MLTGKEIYRNLRQRIFDVIDAEVLDKLTKQQLSEQISSAVDVIISKERLPVPSLFRADIVKNLCDELTGLGRYNR